MWNLHITRSFLMLVQIAQARALKKKLYLQYVQLYRFHLGEQPHTPVLVSMLSMLLPLSVCLIVCYLFHRFAWYVIGDGAKCFDCFVLIKRSCPKRLYQSSINRSSELFFHDPIPPFLQEAFIRGFMYAFMICCFDNLSNAPSRIVIGTDTTCREALVESCASLIAPVWCKATFIVPGV